MPNIVLTDGTAYPVAPQSTGRNFYRAPTGAAIPIPAGAKVLEVKALTADAWIRMGTSSVTAAVPGANITDGTAPEGVSASGSLERAVSTSTHIAIISAGDVLLTWWV